MSAGTSPCSVGELAAGQLQRSLDDLADPRQPACGEVPEQVVVQHVGAGEHPGEARGVLQAERRALGERGRSGAHGVADEHDPTRSWSASWCAVVKRRRLSWDCRSTMIEWHTPHAFGAPELVVTGFRRSLRTLVAWPREAVPAIERAGWNASVSAVSVRESRGRRRRFLVRRDRQPDRSARRPLGLQPSRSPSTAGPSRPRLAARYRRGVRPPAVTARGNSREQRRPAVRRSSWSSAGWRSRRRWPRPVATGDHSSRSWLASWTTAASTSATSRHSAPSWAPSWRRTTADRPSGTGRTRRASLTCREVSTVQRARRLPRQRRLSQSSSSGGTYWRSG